MYIFFRFSQFVTETDCFHDKVLINNRMEHFFEGCKAWTDHRKNERASFWAVKCESYNDCRTEDRFFLDLNDEKNMYHTQITVACINVTRVQPKMSKSEVKKNLAKFESETNEYLR